MRRATLAFIFVTVALDMLALGIIVPVLPKLVLEFEGGDSARAGFWGPAAQAIMTRQVDASEQGRLQGALAGLRGIGGLVGPGLFTGVFAAAVSGGRSPSLSGAPYLLSASMLLVAFAVAWRATQH
jgi:hypothetical protein